MRRTATCSLCAITTALLLTPGCNRNEAPAPADANSYTRDETVAHPQSDAPAVLPQLVDVTEAAGVTFRHHNGAFGKIWMPETIGSGAGFFDYNSDGHPDILLINSSDWPGQESSGRHTPRLYVNDGEGRFSDATAAAGLDAIEFYGMGFAAARLEVGGETKTYLMLTGVGRNYLLRNDGGRFVDITETHLQNDPALANPVPDWSLGAAWFDYDQDGHLDLLVVNYVCWTPETDVFTTLDGTTKSYATPQVYEGQTSRLYRNTGDGKLVEVTARAGLHNRNGKSMSALIDDFNGDLRPDIFITNDTQPNFLYLNNGDGTFREVATDAGCAYDDVGRARAGMGTYSADLNNSGSLAIAIGNFTREPVSLYQRVDGASGLVFADGAGRTRLSRPTLLSLTFGTVFADFDLDGLPDLMIANGHIEPEINRVQRDVTFAQRQQFFRNHKGTFEDVSSEVGRDFAQPFVGRALAVADIDGDGDLDVLFSANNDRPRLFRNDLPSGPGSLRVLLRGAGSNPDAIGAVVTLTVGEQRMSRMIRTGGSYLAQNELTATFGLGSAASGVLEVRWPSGRTEPLGDVKAGATYVVTEGQGVTQTVAHRPRSGPR